MLDNPLPTLLVGLTLFLPGIWLLGWRAARTLFEQGVAALSVALSLALAAWLLLTHAFALVSGSLAVGLALSTSSLGLLGYWTARGAHGSALSWREKPSSLFWCFLVALTVPVAIMAWRWAFHDETSQNGHIAIVASILNAYPPRNLSFPQYSLQYHYGFDLLCAMCVGLFRFSPVRAIDAATVLLWVHALVGLWLVGERIVGRGHGLTVALLAGLGAGAPFTCTESLATASAFGTHVLAGCTRGGLLLNPPLVSYFFQHPWSLGLPLALSCLLLQAQERASHRWFRLGCVALCLAALCVAQTALFCALSAAIVVSELLDERSDSWQRRCASAAVLLGVALLGVKVLGGFWSQPGALSQKVVLHWGIGDTLGASARWMLGSFGVLLLGALGVFWLERRRFLFLALGIGGALVVNLVRYTDTWDIVKFATVGSLGLAVLLSGLIKRLKRSRWSAIGVGGPLSLTVAATLGGLAFVVAVAADLPGVPAMYRQVPPSMSADDRAAATFLRQRMPLDAVMYRQHEAFRPYAVFAGLPQVWVETALPINIALLPERQRLVDTWPADESAYLDRGVRFFVLDGNDGRIGDVVNGWLSKGSARLLARFGVLRVVELVPTPTPQSSPRNTVVGLR